MNRNEQLFEQSQQVIPGGVNSPVRAFKSVGGTPVFFSRAKGSRVWDADGREYIDYVGSWGPAILGHAHPGTVKAVQDAAANGLSFGAPSEAELTIARRIIELVQKNRAIKFAGNDKLRIEREIAAPADRAHYLRDLLRSLGEPLQAGL